MSSAHRRRISGSASSNHGRALVAIDAEGLLFEGVDRTESDRGERPAVGQAVEARQRLGQHHGVAPGQHHHRRAHFELAGAGDGEGHRDQRIEAGPVDPLGEPQRIEAEPLEFVDDMAEGGSIGEIGRRAQSQADADLHRVVLVHLVGGADAPAVHLVGGADAPPTGWCWCVVEIAPAPLG